MTGNKNQVKLNDISKSGKKRPWSEKKILNEYLATAYDNINSDKATRLRECATWLKFKDGLLNKANFCRVRLCPMSAWRRGLKIYAHTMAIMDGMATEKEYGYIFVTFTLRNCNGNELSANIDNMMKSWNKFTKYARFKSAVKGWYRGLEVVHDANEFITKDMYYGNSKKHLKPKKDYYKRLGLSVGDLNPNFDMYHPHFHCVFAVNKSYFKNKEYIDQKEWVQLWKKAMRLDYIPVVDVRKVKGTTAKAVSEIAKYAVKDSDYIIPEDWELTVNTVRLLDKVLDKRRLVAYGGKFKEWHKKLNLDDEVDGDLVVTGEELGIDEKEEKIEYYSWNIGYQLYIRE